MTRVPAPADAKEYARPRVVAGGLDWPTYERQIDKESGWQHWASSGLVLSSPTGSMGLGQLNSKFYRREQWEDPYRNLDTSIALMVGYKARFDSYRKALAAYNWGPGNVGGYTDAAGRAHPAWDGTRAWRCPHEGAVAQCRTEQRDRYLDAILGPGWPEPTNAIDDGNGEAPVAVRYEDYRDPEPAGRFASTPKGIILHGSRSGRKGNPKAAEYLGTARYEQSNPGGLGWNATIGEGVVAVHLSPLEWGLNARAASPKYLAVEIAQATVDEPITDSQVLALADWIRTRVLPAWPTLPMHFPSHAEVEASGETGQHDGKTDVFPKSDPRMDQLRARLLAHLNKEAPPVAVPDQPTYSVGTGILAAMTARGDRPISDERYVKDGDTDLYSEALGASGSIYRWLPAVGRVFRYDPAA